jgi:hypothetical protein
MKLFLDRAESSAGFSFSTPTHWGYLARISHHHCLVDPFEWAVRLLLCVCVLGLTGRNDFWPVRSCSGVSRVFFGMALPGRVPWAKVEV